MLTHKPKITGPECFLGKASSKLISFGSGQPDLKPPEEVLSIIRTYNKERFPYGNIRGEPELINELSKIHNISSNGIAITNGASEALSLSLSYLLKPYDNVLLTRPYYYSYPYLVEINKGNAVFTDLKEWHIDIDDFTSKIKECKVFILNTPSNPTGSVEDASKIKEIQKICNENNVVLIFDEVYHHLNYEKEHFSPRGENVLCVNSFSKTFSLCGLRIGYAYSKNEELIKNIVSQKTHTSMNTSLLSQEVALAALKVPKEVIMKNKKIFLERRNFLYQLLQEAGFEAHKPEGTFYMPVKISCRPEKFVEDLFYKHNVIVYNGNWFGMQNHLRFSFAIDLKAIEEGMKRIRAYLNQI
jgi:aspartate aminotransferase